MTNQEIIAKFRKDPELADRAGKCAEFCAAWEAEYPGEYWQRHNRGYRDVEYHLIGGEF